MYCSTYYEYNTVRPVDCKIQYSYNIFSRVLYVKVTQIGVLKSLGGLLSIIECILQIPGIWKI